MIDIMIDLETMAVTPNGVIMSIGAVFFDPNAEADDWYTLGDTFYRAIDVDSSLCAGLHIDASTLEWWMSSKRTQEARDALFSNPGALEEVLNEFSTWVRGSSSETNALTRVWGNGSTFDITMLECAYSKIGYQQPWKMYNVRCFRTLKQLMSGFEPEREGTHHNALDDAQHQARWAQKIFAELNNTGV